MMYFLDKNMHIPLSSCMNNLMTWSTRGCAILLFLQACSTGMHVNRSSALDQVTKPLLERLVVVYYSFQVGFDQCEGIS